MNNEFLLNQKGWRSEQLFCFSQGVQHCIKGSGGCRMFCLDPPDAGRRSLGGRVYNRIAYTITARLTAGTGAKPRRLCCQSKAA